MKRGIVIVALWTAALGTMAIIYLSQQPEEASAGPPVSSDGIALRTPTHDKAPVVSRLGLPVSEAAPRPDAYRGDRRHRGRSLAEGPAQPALRWSFPTRGRISAQPTVGRDGTIYVGSHDHHLYAISRAGTRVWRRDLEGPIYSSALLDAEGNIYVGSDARFFWSFTSGGRLRWRLATLGDADTSAALGPDGHLCFGAGSSLYSVARDGTPRWRFEVSGKIYASPAIDTDGTVYFGAQDDHFYAVDVEGRLRWSYRTRGDNDSSPILGDDGSIFFVSDDGHVYALNRDGALRWSADLGGYVRAPTALGNDGLVLAAVFGPRPRVAGLDPSSGALRWAFTITVTSSIDTGVASGPLVDREGNLYFGAHDNYVYSLTQSGGLRWVFGVEGDVDTPPMLTSDGVLLFGSDDRSLYALGRP